MYMYIFAIYDVLRRPIASQTSLLIYNIRGKNWRQKNFLLYFFIRICFDNKKIYKKFFW